jgi:hypothetical protein
LVCESYSVWWSTQRSTTGPFLASAVAYERQGARRRDSFTGPLARKREFFRALRSELRCRNYDVLHCHHDILSAIYLLAGVGIPLRPRIVHVHNADESSPTGNRPKQRLFRQPIRQICLSMADRIVGTSNQYVSRGTRAPSWTSLGALLPGGPGAIRTCLPRSPGFRAPMRSFGGVANCSLRGGWCRKRIRCSW